VIIRVSLSLNGLPEELASAVDFEEATLFVSPSQKNSNFAFPEWYSEIVYNDNANLKPASMLMELFLDIEDTSN
jgi:hypothetical protein